MARRIRFTDANVMSTINSIQRRLRDEHRSERRIQQQMETLAFYRTLPLKRVYKWFDQGLSRSAIARRLGVPRHVITYAWDHRYDGKD